MAIVGNFLKLSKLKPLDVLLTRPRKLDSKIIAWLSRGQHSHAAIIISPFVRFESVLSGVRFSLSTPSYVGRDAGGLEFLESTDRYAEVLVLRHPDVDQLPPDELASLQQRLIDATGYFNCLSYPPPSGFAHVARTLRVPPLVAPLLSRLRSPSALHGPFCSQLAAEILSGLGFQPFTIQRPSDEVTPASFTGSNLIAVDCFRPMLPSPRFADWRRLRAVRRALVPVAVALSGYSKRKLMLEDVVSFMDVYAKQALVAGTPSAQYTSGIQSIAASIENIRQYENDRVLQCVTTCMQLLNEQSRAPTWFPSPQTAHQEHLAQEPSPASLLHPIVLHINQLNMNWAQLAEDVPVPTLWERLHRKAR